MSKERLFFIDNLRILLAILVILHHLAIGYGAEGDWYYNEEWETSLISIIILTMFVAINQAFFMGFFFMISSYFGTSSCDRKGEWQFLKDRLKRLGIPLLFYEIVIHPFLIYMVGNYGSRVSFWEFLPAFLLKYFSFGNGPLWFVETLLIFSSIYVLWRLLKKSETSPAQINTPVAGKAPGNAAIALFAIVLGVITFIVRIWFPVDFWFDPLHWQLAHFSQYVALFVLGIVAYRRNWFELLSEAQGRIWTWIALILVPLFLAVAVAGGALEGDTTPFKGGIHWQSLAYSVWEQLMCMAMVVTLLLLFRKRFNTQGNLTRAMSTTAYAVYVFFAPVIVLLELALSGIRMDGGLKFVLVAPIAVILCFLVGYCMKKLPLARDVL